MVHGGSHIFTVSRPGGLLQIKRPVGTGSVSETCSHCKSTTPLLPSCHLSTILENTICFNPTVIVLLLYDRTAPMDSRDKKPSKPSTSRPGGIRTLSDLNRPPPGAESDSDSDAPQEYYTGGEKRYWYLLLLLLLLLHHKISMKHVWGPPPLDHTGIGSDLVQLEWYGPLDRSRARSNLSRGQSSGIGQLVPGDMKGSMVQGWAPQW